MVIVFVALVAIGIGLYFLNKKMSTKYVESQEMLEKNKQQAQIFVIEKKKGKISEANLPKEIKSNFPKYASLIKQCFVKAKVGPKVVTLMCDPKIYEALPVGKSVMVEVAGYYIAGMKGFKTKKQVEEIRKKKKQAAGIQEKWTDKINPKRLFGK
jgi:hypothetical protein